jgi:hypothetical protein
VAVAPAPYFHHLSLAHRFEQDITDAFLEARISAQEKSWLAQLLEPDVAPTSPSLVPRVDRLITEDGLPILAELAGALLISYPPSSGDGRVYLITLVYGLERFTDRVQLHTRLNELMPLRAADRPAFEFQQLDGRLFSQQTLRIVDQQVDHLLALDQHLRQVPSLHQALQQAASKRLLPAFPDGSADLTQPRVQLLHDILGGAGEAVSVNVLAVNSVVEIMAAILTGQTLPAGQRRVWWGPDGEQASLARTLLYESALTGAVSDLTECYEAMLEEHWLDSFHGLACRERVAAAMTEALRQQLLARRQDGTLSAARFRALTELLGGHQKRRSQDASCEARRLCVVGANGELLKLAGPLLLELKDADLKCLVLYSPFKALRLYPDLAALARDCSSVEGHLEFKRYLSLDDQALFPAEGALQIEAYALNRRLADEQVDAVIGLQKRNLRFALSQPLSEDSQACAAIDDALDLRALIDGRLLHLDGGGRWLASMGSSDDPAPRDTSVAAAQPISPSWIEQLDDVEDRVQKMSAARPDLATYAGAVLSPYLAVLYPSPPAASLIQIHWLVAASGSVTSAPVVHRIGLVDALLERLCVASPATLPNPLPEHAVMLDTTVTERPVVMQGLAPDLVGHVLERVARDFFDAYLLQVEGLRTRPYRVRNAQLDVGRLQWRILWDLIRIDWDIHDRLETIDVSRLSMVSQVLVYPERSQRAHLGAVMVEVYSLSLRHDPSMPAAALAAAVVLLQPGRPDNGVLFWSPARGLEEAGSLTLLEVRLNARLFGARTRERWLELLAKADQALVREHLEQPANSDLTLETSLVEGDFISVLQNGEDARQRSDLERAVAVARTSQMSAPLLVSFVQQAQGAVRPIPALDKLCRAAQSMLLQAKMPAWLRDASLDDLIEFSAMFKRFQHVVTQPTDFLTGIAPIRAFALQTLVRQLKVDFPDVSLDPDTINVTITRYVAAPVPAGSIPSSMAAATLVNQEPLTDFALNHFSDIHGATISVTLPAGVAHLAGLTSDYVRQLVRSLDVGMAYQTMLNSRLDPANPDYAVRRQRFVTQMPARMLMTALVMKLKNELSETAYRYLETLIDMPDSVARQPEMGQEITLRPLQLLPAPGMAPDTASGMYVIGPMDTRQGPVVLHALLNHAYCFKEYPTSAALLEDLRSSEPLQTLVLDRLDAQVRSRYDNAGFIEAHIPFSTEGFYDVPFGRPAQVQLAGTPQTGNVLHFLFGEIVQMLKSLSRKQSVTTAQADWKSFVYLLSLGAQQTLMLLPGHVGVAIGLWQSQSLFKDSAHAAVNQDWGKAAAELTAGLGVVISFRRSLEPNEAGEAAADEEPTLQPVVTQFSWRNTQLAPELEARLRAFQAHDIVLSDLPRDALYNLYQDPVTLEKYAAVAGQVYRVKAFEDHWYIIGPQGRGPRIRLDDSQQWALDLDWGLRGGGGALTRVRTASTDTDSEVDEVLAVEARGIKQIRKRYLPRAVMIFDARQQAIRYLDNCLANLRPVGAMARLHPMSEQLIADFFGVQTVSPALGQAVRKTVADLYVAVTDPSLSGFKSKRYVVGTNKPGHETTKAFVIDNDPEKRIFFTDRFFEAPQFRLNRERSAHWGFNMGNHSRAASFIHELSHQVCHTHDIAYLEASAPFVDLLADPLSPDDTLKAYIQHLRTRTLSHRADPADLFVQVDKNLQGNPGDWDDNGEKAVLRITGQATLDQARRVFLADAQIRSQVILSNADSVTLLVCTLGRQRFS